uniref:CS domain-containing protein n=1 Tax=Strigamia maritima TaxID=126957 RepID=T1IHX8_STRMM
MAFSDAVHHFNKANEAFIDEEYALAIDYYTKAIAIDFGRQDYYRNRANSYMKLEKYREAKCDVDRALELGTADSKLCLWKGTACYQLRDYEEAEKAFFKGKALVFEESEKAFYQGRQLEFGNEAKDTFNGWLTRCAVEIKELKDRQKIESEKIEKKKIEKERIEKRKLEKERLEKEKVENERIEKERIAESERLEKENCHLPYSLIKLRHEWYQTEPSVIVTILVKNVNSGEVSVEICDKTLRCKVRRNEKRDDYELDINLAHTINPERSTWKILSSKIEIQMKKMAAGMWKTLHDDQTRVVDAKKKKNWDKVVSDCTEIDDQDAGGDEFFANIFSQGSDEMKRAMNKSFVESGGTTLSTNWEEVRKEKVKGKAPSGMEWKQWDGKSFDVSRL